MSMIFDFGFKKGGHIVFMNCNRNVETESITQEKANELGKQFLESREIKI